MKRLLFVIVGVIVSACGAAPPTDRIAAVENALRGPVVVAGEPLETNSLAERMRHYNVPGVSIAIIDGGRVDWAKGYGVARPRVAVTPETRFQAGSISKAVTAVAAMKLIGRDRMSFDTDVDRFLRSWKLPRDPAEGREPVTLRQLLSHTAGIGVHGFYPGYEPGSALPTPVQILNGESPAINPPIRVETTPGIAFDYSGGGYQVVQQIVTDVSGAPFEVFMRNTFLEPLGMTASSFRQVSPDDAPEVFAVGHDRDGAELLSKWFLHPEMAAAGLWSTPTDLARLGIAVSDAWRGRRSRTLSRDIARTMLTPQLGGWSLGFQLEGEGTALRFRHGGDNPGFKAVMVVYPALGKGAVIMTNADRGDRLADEILFSIAAAYGWEDYSPKTKVPARVHATELERVAGTYLLEAIRDTGVIIAPKGDALSFTIVQPSGQSTVEFFPSGSGRFFRRDMDFDLQFSDESPAKQVTLIQDGETFTATRVPPDR